jgi:hypothetical protein
MMRRTIDRKYISVERRPLNGHAYSPHPLFFRGQVVRDIVYHSSTPDRNALKLSEPLRLSPVPPGHRSLSQRRSRWKWYCCFSIWGGDGTDLSVAARHRGSLTGRRWHPKPLQPPLATLLRSQYYSLVLKSYWSHSPSDRVFDWGPYCSWVRYEYRNRNSFPSSRQVQ